MDFETIWTNRHVTRFRRLLYLVSPNETSFETVEEVPQYVNEAAPYFLISLLLETSILIAKGHRKSIRPNDAFNSIGHGLISTLQGLLVRSCELASYIWVYERFCVYSLPWNSPWTWILAMLGVDFGYYWVHRCGHEVNIMWAGHQTHHSSEDYNLSTALRQSAIHRYVAWIFYLPMALFIPPAQFQVHIQFNLLYQFWIHTEVIQNLGPLEYILNTPSHHRVHHGRNPYCIDKNYGGTFIIWDRIFGTFEPEGEKVIYGLVHPLATWDFVHGQLGHLIYILKTFQAMDTWQDKWAVIWKGPGWTPGKPRLGLHEDLPQIEHPVLKYNSSLSRWGSLYVWIHFLLLITFNSLLGLHKSKISAWMIVIYIIFALFTLSSFGALYDNKSYAPTMEFLRCIIFLIAAQLHQPFAWTISAVTAIYVLYFLSALLWSYPSLKNVHLVVDKKKIK